ncbi:hypothetical protein [Streptomyces atratus]|uniref:hypothetical protein n=1 Tax=Streptomyces atratus TaxID=1893 RepID=UPI00364EEEFF
MTDPTTPAAEGQLPPYSGEDVTCGKCANVGAYTSYRAAGEHSSNEAPTWGRSAKGERLERSCSRCSFIWDEALVRPVDERTVIDDLQSDYDYPAACGNPHNEKPGGGAYDSAHD